MGNHPQPHEQWTTVLLPEIAWGGDDWPDYLSVAHGIDGEWRVYVPESQTCTIEVKDNMAETDGMGDVWLECDQCHWQMPLEPTTPKFNYCPNCGRRCVE